MEEEIMKGFAAPVQNPQEINPKAMKFSVYIMEGFWEEFPQSRHKLVDVVTNSIFIPEEQKKPILLDFMKQRKEQLLRLKNANQNKDNKKIEPINYQNLIEQYDKQQIVEQQRREQIKKNKEVQKQQTSSNSNSDFKTILSQKYFNNILQDPLEKIIQEMQTKY